MSLSKPIDNKKESEKENRKEYEEKSETGEMTFDSDYFGSITIKLNKFVPGTFPPINLFATITVYGKRKTGKSVFCKWMIQAFKHEIPWAWVFTLTKFNLFYKGFIPDKFILTSFNSSDLYRIMARQIKAIELHSKQVAMGVPEKERINPRAACIWDDYMGNDIKFNKALHEYYLTGRHYFMLNFFMTQYVKETPPAIRSNTDYAILFNSDQEPSMEIYGEEFSGKMKKRDFIAFFEYATREKHTFLCINNDPNVPIEEKYYVGKADILPAEIDYVLGCPYYWKDDMKQLESIADGSLQKAIDLKAEMNEHVDNNKENYKKHKIENVTDLEKVCHEKSNMSRYNFDSVSN